MFYSRHFYCLNSVTAVNLSFKTFWPKSEDNDNSCGDKKGVSNCEFLAPVILDVELSWCQLRRIRRREKLLPAQPNTGKDS